MSVLSLMSYSPKIDGAPRRGSSPMGAPARPQSGGHFSIVHRTRIAHFDPESHTFAMGSTGPNWRCPWCGRRDNDIRPLHGYAHDDVGYPICFGDEHSCSEKLALGITRNGVRAGALYHILKNDAKFECILRVQPSFYLDLCDFLHGTRSEPRSRPLFYGWNRMSAWHEYYVDHSERDRLIAEYDAAITRM